MTHVSIIICTRNRAEDLRKTLYSIDRVEVPADLPTELLVVNNGSTDQTARVVQGAKLAKISIRYLYEPRPGQCHARNAGMAAASGDILLFTDDDAHPPADWIEGMCRPIAEGRAQAVAGNVRLADSLQRRWMSPQHRGWLAATYWHQPDKLVGANMAFAKAATYDAGMRFDPELDPGALGFFGDTLFSWQLEKRGLPLLGRPDIAVEHHVSPDRLLRQAFLDTARKYGRSLAYISHHWTHQHPAPHLGRLTRALAAVTVTRLLNWRHRLTDEGVDVKEFRRERNLAYLLQLRRERRRARNYDRFGYVKLRGLLPERTSSPQHEPEYATAGLGHYSYV